MAVRRRADLDRGDAPDWLCARRDPGDRRRAVHEEQPHGPGHSRHRARCARRPRPRHRAREGLRLHLLAQRRDLRRSGRSRCAGWERAAVPRHDLFHPPVRDRNRGGRRQPARRDRCRLRHGRIRTVRRLPVRRGIPAGIDRHPTARRTNVPHPAIAPLPAGCAMNRNTLALIGITVLGLIAPFLLPQYSNEIAVMWLMIVFASTWDVLGGQMGYNSLGNIVFFGAGMYISAIVPIGLYYDVAMYTSGARTMHIVFTNAQYFTGFTLGLVAAVLVAPILGVLAGFILFGLRGPYFAIGTLGLAIAAAEIVASWTYVDSASGVAMPFFRDGP